MPKIKVETEVPSGEYMEQHKAYRSPFYQVED